MDIELALSVFGFALSVGGIVPVLYTKEGRTRVVTALIFAALIPTTGAVLYREYEREQEIKYVMSEIVRKLDTNTWTYEQIDEAVFHQPPQITREALSRLVRSGKLADRLEVFLRNDIEWKVRAYYVK